MATGWKFGKIAKEKLMALEEPGKALLFDADKGLVEETMAKFDIRTLVGSLLGKDDKSAYKSFEEFGKELINFTINLADGKYLDRTGEMVEKVYKQTGISFPHRLERYVELSIFGPRPTDRWNVTRATPTELILQVSGCSVHKALTEAGIKGLPCKGLCLASFETAAVNTGDRISVVMPKAMPDSGLCEFVFSLQPGG